MPQNCNQAETGLMEEKKDTNENSISDVSEELDVSADAAGDLNDGLHLGADSSRDPIEGLDSAEPPTSDISEDREHLEAELRLTKLKFETRLLRRQLSRGFTVLELFKSIASIAGVLTAIVALAAFFWSVWNGLEQLNLAREGRNQERLNAAIKLIGEANENQRSTGVLSLQEFLTPNQTAYHRQVILILTNQLTYEPSAAVRKRIVDIFNQIDEKTIALGVLNEAVKSLAESSRALMIDGTIKRAVLENYNLNIPASPEKTGTAKSVGDAMAALLRKGVTERDLTGIFCLKCDFKNAKLSKAKFDHSLLSFADFSGASLEGASFEDALLENTKFISADLRQASFRGRSRHSGMFGVLLDEVEDEFYAFHRNNTNGPLFNCANLQKATFSYRVIFTLISDKNDRVGQLYWGTSFVKANLDQTNFSEAVIIGLDNAKEKDVPFTNAVARSSTGWPVMTTIKNILSKKDKNGGLPELKKDERIFSIKLQAATTVTDAKKRFLTSLKLMEMAFAGSNWQLASLPQGFGDYLNAPLDPLIEKRSFVASYSPDFFDAGCQAD